MPVDPRNYMALQRRPQPPQKEESNGGGGIFADIFKTLLTAGMSAIPGAGAALGPATGALAGGVGGGGAQPQPGNGFEQYPIVPFERQGPGVQTGPSSQGWGGSLSGAPKIGSVTGALGQLGAGPRPSGFEQYPKVPFQPQRPDPNAAPTAAFPAMQQGVEQEVLKRLYQQYMSEQQGGAQAAQAPAPQQAPAPSPSAPGPQMVPFPQQAPGGMQVQSQSYSGPLPQVTPTGMAPLDVPPAGLQPGGQTPADIQRAIQQQQAYIDALMRQLNMPTYGARP